MLSRVSLMLCLCILWSCGSSPASDPGPLVDNTKWEPTTHGDDVLGPPPPDAECMLEPIDCDEEYPWPEGECVTFDATSTCVTAFVPECDVFTVLSVYTRMLDRSLTLCNWITLTQLSLRAIRAGDQVEVRTRHADLNAPHTTPPTQARMTFVIGDEIALDHHVLIPSGWAFFSATWTATKDYPAGTPLLWHVDNHGANEYQLLEVNIL